MRAASLANGPVAMKVLVLRGSGNSVRDILLSLRRNQEQTEREEGGGGRREASLAGRGTTN